MTPLAAQPTNTTDNHPYRGRFAPSPTGELHLGSLAAALASYLQARAHGGQWLVRIDDIDTPRVRPGSAAGILQTLEEYGLLPDEPVTYQSQYLEQYQKAVTALLEKQLAFHCGCSRADLNEDGSYPGTCRDGLPPGKPARSVRIRAPQQAVCFDDLIAGPQHDDIRRTAGDFVILRADGIFAYQLCTAMDDASPGITEVVRGADLLPSTGRQVHIQRALGLTSPRYAHIPVITDGDGNKLSKRRADDPLNRQQPAAAMRAALTHLAHPPPADITAAPDMLAWATAHWDIRRLREHGSASAAG